MSVWDVGLMAHTPVIVLGHCLLGYLMILPGAPLPAEQTVGKVPRGPVQGQRQAQTYL